MSDPVAPALAERYRQSLRQKQAALAAAWFRWLQSPSSAERPEYIDILHKLAGSAPLYGYHELGAAARRLMEAAEALDGLARPWSEMSIQVLEKRHMAFTQLLGAAIDAN
jgi:HPt (histidine-containing phosphotransfer) domain-containing protein